MIALVLAGAVLIVGASHSGSTGESRNPAPTEPKASTIIGTVMVAGDSCGW